MNLFKWLDERTGFCAAASKIANWTVPAGKCCCRFLPTAIVFLFLLQGITGLFLWAFYSASATSAWESVYYIQYCLPGGWFVRGVHHYSAQLFVGLTGFYVLLLILHGAYRRPREFVYWSALVMFLFSLGSCLTGDLLPWSLSGYFATITRVSFLQLLPGIGVPLYQLVVGGPDPQFGTLTLTRFLLLHICVFGGGGFVLICLWKYFDIRSRKILLEEKRFDGVHKCALACATKARRSFWGSEAFFGGIACLVVFAAVLLLVFQHSLTSDQIANRAPTLPAEAYLGAQLTSPVDVSSSYDAARPEWSFRALYHMTKLPIFSKIGMVFAIFVVPPILLAFFFVLPILGRTKPLHYAIVAVTAVIFVIFCRWTYLSYWDDYQNPDHAPAFLASKGEAERLADRAVELTFAPTGIPKTGALSLLQDDPFVQGPKLFAQHCASCHNFTAADEAILSDDYTEISCSEPTAPNLYGAGSAKWIAGFTNEKTLADADCFGKTAFAEKGSMIGFMRGAAASVTIQKDGSYILMSNGLVAKAIEANASPAFDILESVFEDFIADEANLDILTKILNEDEELDEAAVAAAQDEYVAKLAELISAKFADEEFMSELEPKMPTPVCAALEGVLIDMLSDEKYRELLFDADNVTYIQDEDAATFLTDSYLATFNINSPEPIDPQSQDARYIERLRDATLESFDDVAAILAEEAKLDAPRPFVDGQYLGLAENAISDMDFLTCTNCHAFYGLENDHACDLRAYMSRDWIAGIIADPTSVKYYGAKNDRMPAYCPTEGDKLMTEKEVGLLADWLSGKWYRAPQVENSTLFGTFGAAKAASQAAAQEKAADDLAKAAEKAQIAEKVAQEEAAKAQAEKEKAEKAAAAKAKREADDKAAAQKAVKDAQAAAKKAADDAKAAVEKANAEAKALADKAAADARAAIDAANAAAEQKATSAGQTAASAIQKANAERDAALAAQKTAAEGFADANVALDKALAAKTAAEQAAIDVRVAADKQLDAAKAELQKSADAQAALNARLAETQAALDAANAANAELQAKLDAANAPTPEPAPAE